MYILGITKTQIPQLDTGRFPRRGKSCVAHAHTYMNTESGQNACSQSPQPSLFPPLTLCRAAIRDYSCVARDDRTHNNYRALPRCNAFL